MLKVEQDAAVILPFATTAAILVTMRLRRSYLETRRQSEDADNNSNRFPYQYGSKSPVLKRLIDETRRDNSEHQRAEQTFWNRQIKVGALLNWITAGAAIVGLIGLWYVSQGLIESRHASEIAAATNIASNRGWLFPAHIEVKFPFVLNKALSYVISVKNVGRSPVTDAGWIFDQGTISGPLTNDFRSLNFGDNDLCKNATPEKSGQVTYSDELQHTALTTDTANGGSKQILIDEKMITGRTLIFVRGCIAYQTVGIIGKSGYCFVVVPTINEQGAPAWIAPNCPRWNTAE